MDWARLDTAVVAAVLCGLAGLLVPRLIARLPEPEPEPEPELEGAHDDPAPPKEPYVDIAARPGLALWAAGWSAGSAALIGLAVGWWWPLVYLLPVVPLLVALSVIDLRTQMLPTLLIRPVYLLVALGIAVTWLALHDTSDVVRAVIGGAMAFVVFFVAWFVHPRGMGYGDVRLSGALGLALGHLGWGPLFIGLYAGFLIFGLPGLVLAVVRWDRSLLKTSFPFGPFMILGALIGVLWGHALWARFIGA